MTSSDKEDLDEISKKTLKKMKVSIDINDEWFKKFQTLTLAGNGTALVVLITSFEPTKNKNSIELIRDNVELFAPFAIGLILSAIATFWAARINAIVASKKIYYDTLKEGSPSDKLIDDQLAQMDRVYPPPISLEERRTRKSSLKGKIEKATRPIADELNRRQIKDANSIFNSLKLSALLFLFGIIYIGFGDRINSAIKSFIDCII